MKLRYSIGLILIAVGFAIPFVLKRIFPTFLYASIPYTISFWAGFIFILLPIENHEELNSNLKWARYAIFANIILTLIANGYFFLIFYLDIHKGIGINIMQFLALIARPVQSIFNKIVPPPIVQLPNGSVQIAFSFIRSLLTDIVNLLFFVLCGVVLKTIKDKKITSVFSRAQGPCAR